MTQPTPVRARSVRIAPLDTDSVAHAWTGLTDAFTGFTPVLDQMVGDFRDLNLQLHRTASVTFRPSRRLRRIVLGPRWTYDRRRHRQVTRRKALARRGRR